LSPASHIDKIPQSERSLRRAELCVKEKKQEHRIAPMLLFL
jgi:hypothetical protein